MAKKITSSTRKRGKPKYFNLSESNSGGMDNFWSVYKKRKGFYLWATELGEVAGPCATILEALDYDGNQYGGDTAEIETNIPLEELFEIMNTRNFEPLLHNLDTLTLNNVELDAQSFKNFVAWYAKSRDHSAAIS